MAAPVAIKLDLSNTIADWAHKVACLTGEFLVTEHPSRHKEFQRVTILNRTGESNLRKPCAEEKSMEGKSAYQCVPHHGGEAVRKA